MNPGIVLMFMIIAAATIIVLSLNYRYRRHELKHQERMSAIEKGVALPVEPLEQPPGLSPRSKQSNPAALGHPTSSTCRPHSPRWRIPFRKS